MKRKLSLILAFIMILGILPLDVFAANPANLGPKNDKAYEEVTIDGKAYKVYNVEDLLDEPVKERSVAPKTMLMSAKSLGNPGSTDPKPITFVLELNWSTIDRPVENLVMPVYVGDPKESKSIKLGEFVVNSYAHPGEEQRINMTQEYFGPSPSNPKGPTIDNLVKKAWGKMKIAIPEDMRYDFTLAAAKWDSKKTEGTAGVDEKVIFVIEGKQSVMHGYGIRWFDTNPVNRDKIEARWEGKENQTSDVKLGTVDRDYSVYKNNVIDTNNKANVKTYPDGTEYSNYDYYYNGKKITTYADADNLGKYDSELLAIATKAQAPYASLKVKDGNDYKLKGEKVLKDGTKYFYDSVGDYRTFHVLSMREALKVKFNTGKGSLTDGGDAGQIIQVNNKDFQEIGYGEKLAGNESGNVVTIPDGKALIPPTEINGKQGTYEFKGWALEADKDKSYDDLKSTKKLIYPDEGNTEKDAVLDPLKKELTTLEKTLKRVFL